MLISTQVSPVLTTRFWLIAGFITLVFFTGGASRVDPLSLAILRPVSVFLSVVALLTLRRDHWRGRKSLAVIMAALFGLALSHVIPLPPGIWQSFPGRAEIVEIDALAGLGDVWRPLTLTPMNGWHAINSLFVPLAVLLIGVQLSKEELLHMVPVLIGLGIVSALFGIVQIVGGANSPAYLYRITNSGSAVGLFANRNHAALMLAMLLPLLATYVTTTPGASGQVELRKISAFAIALVVLPLILVTGSRAGLVFAAVGVASMFLLYRPVAVRALRRGENPLRLVSFPVLGGMAVLLAAVSTILFSRAESIERVFGETAVEDARVDYWTVALDLVWKYFPAGSGSGSFAEVYQIIEPDYLLNFSFLNHAHNDWLETAVTFGLPGIILLVATTLSVVRRSLTVWFGDSASGRGNELARLATILLLMAAIGSFADYPLRTPIMMAVAVLTGLWLCADRMTSDARDKNFGKGS